jgi:hypothetical protein
MSDDVIVRCTAHGMQRVHHHSRTVGRTTGSSADDNGARWPMTGTRGSAAPYNIERHRSPDGTMTLFAVRGYTTEECPPHTPEGSARAEHEFHVGDVVTMRTTHAGLDVSERLIVADVAPDRRDPGAALVRVNRPDNPGVHVNTFFARRLRLINPAPNSGQTTPQESTMPITTGSVVTVMTGGTRPTSTNPDHQFVVVVEDGDTRSICAAYTGITDNYSGHGWVVNGLSRGRVPDGPLRQYITDHNVSMWSIETRHLVPVPEAEVRLPEGMAALRNHLTGGAETPTETEVNIHPLTSATVRQHYGRRVMLHSILGTLNGNRITFGCQTFDLSVVQRAHGSITFEEGGVRVSMPTTLPTAYEGTDYVTVGDRRLSRNDVSAYTQRVILDGSAPEAVTHDGIVMQHGFYGCSEHEHEVIFLLTDHHGEARMGKLRENIAAEGGIVGLRTGLDDLNFRDCRPVSTSCTASTMRLAHQRTYSVVPTRSEQQAALIEAGFTPVTVPTGRREMTLCNETGAPITRAA